MKKNISTSQFARSERISETRADVTNETEKQQNMNQLNNDEAVYRTAPATPGLLKK